MKTLATICAGAAAAGVAYAAYRVAVQWADTPPSSDGKDWTSLPRVPAKHILGMAGEMMSIDVSDVHTLLERFGEEVGGTYVATIFGQTRVFLVDAEQVHAFFKARPKFLGKKNHAAYRTNPQLFMADGQHWQEQRRRTAPAFNEAQTDKMIPTFARAGHALCDAISLLSKRAESVDVSALTNRASLQAMCEAAYSSQLDLVGEDAKDASHPLPIAISRLMTSLAKNAQYPYRHLMAMNLPRWFNMAFVAAYREINASFDDLEAMGRDVVRRRIAANANANANAGSLQKAPAKDFLDVVASLDETQFGGVMAVASVAGSETTALTTAWLLHRFAQNPLSYARARREVLAWLESSGGLEAALASFSTTQLPYLEGAVLEALRMHPAVDGLAMAHVASEDFDLAGIRFKKAAGFIPLFKVAMRKEMTRLGWTGLDAFDPTRWLAADGSIDDEKAKQILSFGGGARLCPGNRFAKKQLLISSVLILSQFSSVRHDEGVSGVQGCNVQQEMNITIRPRNLRLFFD
eukprot:CAMPEP_0180163582 /NCGR_PEP_ID=MMETSP0986-20121125/29875_1 /TAXON_ID=697907 /ORGANISM="non described non described, Strain CCMP2293" /LENGTH=520 /DNA_ID=CAMNT_0022114225 /DNA_START=28 /DNA_END=1590 /DNA_ORIENTATION=-